MELNEYDVVLTIVKYVDSDKIKFRPALVIYFNGREVGYYKITSKFVEKSDYIKSKYFEIKDWLQAGLRTPSWVDTINYYQISKNEVSVKVIGSLTFSDRTRLEEFLAYLD
jgi:hypothetical protein